MDSFYLSSSWRMNTIKTKNSWDRQWKYFLKEGDFQRGFCLERGLCGFPQHKNRRKRWKDEISNSNCSKEAFNRTTQRVPSALVSGRHEELFPGPGLERYHDLWGSSVRTASGSSQQEHGPQWLHGFCRRVSLASFQKGACPMSGPRSRKIPEEWAAAEVEARPTQLENLWRTHKITRSAKAFLNTCHALE